MNLEYSWNEISNDDFLKSALGVDNKITLIWIPSFTNATRCRKCKISSSEHWIALMDNALIPRYKQGKSPMDENAEIFNLYDYYIETRNSEKMDAIRLLKIAASIQITTAYDEKLGKRLIADGLKRAIGIRQLINSNEAMPESTVMECYGTAIGNIFPIEFGHIR